jgi:hypothetical protein
MIKRVVDVEGLDIVFDNFVELAKEHPVKHYGGIEFNPHTLRAAWRNDNLLINSAVLICNFIDDKTIDALSWFTIAQDWRTNSKVATSYLWVSKDRKHGLAVFLEAIDTLKRKRVDVINVGYLLSSPDGDKIEKLLKKMKFMEEDKSYSIRLV